MTCPLIWGAGGVYRQCWVDVNASCEECELAAINERLRASLEQPSINDCLSAGGVRHQVGRLTFRQRSQYYGRMPGVALRWLNAPEGFEL